MEEKTIIQSRRMNIKLVSFGLVLVGVLLFVVMWNRSTSYGFYADKIADGEWGYVLFSMVPYFAAVTILPFAIAAGVFYAWMSKVELTVTNKRVYGNAAFGKRVDLPFDSISAVGTGLFKSISVATASGSIKFGIIKNRDEIHAALSKLLVERQGKHAVATIRQEIPQSNADELKKFKELCESGIITQEEFEAKKKQLLGL